MKKLLVSVFFVFAMGQLIAQPTFDFGLKGGVNFSNLSFELEDYSSESIVKSHFGAFGRIGLGRIFIQPEAYYSRKGGNVTTDPLQTIISFDYSSIDVPLLLGVKIVKGDAFGLHALVGPVFSGITTEEILDGVMFDREYYKNNYFSMQYGIGVDILFLTLDARFEQGLSNLYQHGTNRALNKTFMISAGFKIF